MNKDSPSANKFKVNRKQNYNIVEVYVRFINQLMCFEFVLFALGNFAKFCFKRVRRTKLLVFALIF